MPSSTSSRPATTRSSTRTACPRASMQLLDPSRGRPALCGDGQARESRGGSAANTMAGIAAMGGRAAFIGQVADDQLGEIFDHDMRALGVRFDTPPLAGGPPTGRCLILVTPDAQRTMNTCPGASHELQRRSARRGADRVGRDPLSRRLSVGPGQAARGDDARRSRSPMRAGPRGRLHLDRKRVHRRPQAKASRR